MQTLLVKKQSRLLYEYFIRIQIEIYLNYPLTEQLEYISNQQSMLTAYVLCHSANSDDQR